MLTARNLKELHELGASARKQEIKAGAQWLLARERSPVNLGMFFLTDELVELQRQRLKERKRFRDRKPKELVLAAEGDPMIRESCGPRILWPNGIVLEALVGLGYEKHERVQTALKSTALTSWCECGAQAGHGIRTKDGVLSPPEIEAKLDSLIEGQEAAGSDRFRCGGVNGDQRLLQVDPSFHAPELGRIAHQTKSGKDVYELRMPSYVGTCELFCLRAFFGVTGKRLRRRAEAHIGNIVGRQRPNGTIDDGRSNRFLYNSQAIFLRTIAAFDGPIARVGVLRYIPWVIDSQNKDGSWGDVEHAEATTLAVVQSLVSARDYLPQGLLP